MTPGQIQRLYKQRLTKSTPFLSQTCCNQAAVIAGVRQVDGFALKHGPGQHLRHRLRIRGAGNLLKLQPHLGYTGEPGPEAQITVATRPLFPLHQPRQRSKYPIERAFMALCLFNKLPAIFILIEQLFR